MTFLPALSFALLVGLGQIAYAQGKLDNTARKNADAFIAALKIAELAEGKQALRQTLWSADAYVLGDLPVVIDQRTLFEGMFDTDISGVRGYKRLIEAKVQSQARTTLTARYILISYKDRKSGAWRIFDFRDLAGSSIEHEIEATRRRLDDTQYSTKQFNYSSYAYWLTFGGKLNEAKQAHLLAATINQTQPAKRFSQTEHDDALRVLNSIIEK